MFNKLFIVLIFGIVTGSAFAQCDTSSCVTGGVTTSGDVITYSR